MKKFLLSLALVVGSHIVVAQEVQVAEVKAEVTFKDTVINQTTQFVERTVNLLATPFLSDKDIECMAKNIFYEAGSEPTEGKIAVGIVTLNRTQDGRFGKSVCDVVKARTVVVKNQEIKKTEVVRVGYFGSAQEVEKKVVVAQVSEESHAATQQTVTEQAPVIAADTAVKADTPKTSTTVDIPVIVVPTATVNNGFTSDGVNAILTVNSMRGTIVYKVKADTNATFTITTIEGTTAYPLNFGDKLRVNITQK